MREYKDVDNHGDRSVERPWQTTASPLLSFAEELRRRGVIVEGVTDREGVDNDRNSSHEQVLARPLADSERHIEEGTIGRRGNMAGPPPRRPHRWRRKIIITAIVLVVVWALLYVLPIPLGNIQVVGSDKVTVADVMAAGDIRNPVNLLQIDTGRLEERLSHDLRVEVAKVSYVFPLTLKVSVTDRKPLAVVATKFGFATMDKNGQVIAIGPAIEDTAVPIISGVKLGNILLGDKLENKAILEALVYLNALTPEGLKGIAEVNVGDENQLTAYTVDGLPLRLGDGTDLVKKAQLSEEMITDVKTRGVTAQYLDVNVTSPFIKVQ